MSVEEILRHAERCALRAEADPLVANRYAMLGQLWCAIAEARIAAHTVRLNAPAANSIQAALRARSGRGIF